MADPGYERVHSKVAGVRRLAAVEEASLLVLDALHEEIEGCLHICVPLFEWGLIEGVVKDDSPLF